MCALKEPHNHLSCFYQIWNVPIENDGASFQGVKRFSLNLFEWQLAIVFKYFNTLLISVGPVKCPVHGAVLPVRYYLLKKEKYLSGDFICSLPELTALCRTTHLTRLRTFFSKFGLITLSDSFVLAEPGK